jgi:hypothetical protein
VKLLEKQTRTLVEIGLLFIAASIALDYLLGAYQILLWLALSFEFIFFGSMILSTLWEHVAPKTDILERRSPQPEDQLTRLEHLCEAAIVQGDQTAAELLSKRVRSLVFAAAANNLNTSEATLRTLAQEEPNRLEAKIRDTAVFNVLITNISMIQRRDTKLLEALLGKVEEWTT